jgi:hypothetical protein
MLKIQVKLSNLTHILLNLTSTMYPIMNLSVCIMGGINDNNKTNFDKRNLFLYYNREQKFGVVK